MDAFSRNARAALAAVVVALPFGCAAGSAGSNPGGGGAPWPVAAGTWRDDAAWYDGQAEVAVYDATRVIYGAERRYRATAYTNKQRMDPATTTKSAGDGGVEVFKHHWSERVPTERYDYDFSTAVFTRTDDLSTFKWTAATQEDCGASFKQAWLDGGGWRLLESVYFPGAGVRDEHRPGALPLPWDALTLVLRDFPFDAPPGEPLAIEVLPSQRDTHRVAWEPESVELHARGREVVDVPYGALDAWRLDVVEPGATSARASYWFAADGEAPLLHALVRYRDRDGLGFDLVSLQRYPYWERGPR